MIMVVHAMLLPMKHFFFLSGLLALLAGCVPEAVKVGNDDNATIGTQVLQQVMPGQSPVTTPDHGRELWFALTAMGGVPGTPANGVAQAHYLEDGTFIHTIQLNIERAPEGFFYEAWLSKSGGEPVSTGHLRTPFGDVRHQLKHIGDADLRSYTSVRVTLEKDDGNPAPSETVAEGLLKEIKR